MRNRRYFAKGKRGFIDTAMIGRKKVAIKYKNPKSEAGGRILNEGKMLELLNTKGIGPKLVTFSEKEVVYEFVEGEMIIGFIEKATQKMTLKTLLNVIDQCHTLDSMGLVKEEMTHPIKHIIVTKKGPVMIDFERTHPSQKPHNVTQFVQFLTSSNLKDKLRKKGIFINTDRIRKVAAVYKKKRTRLNLNRLKNLIVTRTPFQTKVLLKIAAIPKGKVSTYQDIAKSLRSNAVRAVGSAVKGNPCAPFDIPCHRVVKSDGTLGNYSGTEYTKEELLKKEGVRIKGDKILDFESVRL